MNSFDYPKYCGFPTESKISPWENLLGPHSITFTSGGNGPKNGSAFLGIQISIGNGFCVGLGGIVVGGPVYEHDLKRIWISIFL